MEISYRQELCRKAVHLSSLWIAALLWFSPAIFSRPQVICGIFFLLLTGLNLLVEYAYYRQNPLAVRLYGPLFGRMLRENHGRFRPSGSPPFLLAAALCGALFPGRIAGYAIAALVCCDTAAALVGRRFGKHRFPNGKSAEGTAAFILTGVLLLAILSTGLPGTPRQLWFGGMGGILLAAVLELFNTELRLDDNLTIPLAAGGVLMLAAL